MLWICNVPHGLMALTPQLGHYFENCGFSIVESGWKKQITFSVFCLLPSEPLPLTSLGWAILQWAPFPWQAEISVKPGAKFNFPSFESSWHVFWSQEWKVANTGIKVYGALSLVWFGRVTYHSLDTLSLKLSNWEMIASRYSIYFKQNAV